MTDHTSRGFLATGQASDGTPATDHTSRGVLATAQRLLKVQPTLKSEEVPVVFRELEIHAGYRPPGRSSCYYLQSIFQVHNETLNIWTHALGMLLILYLTWTKVTALPPELAEYAVLLLGYGFCCAVCCAGSVAAHTLHSRSTEDHYVWFLVDYICIGLYAMGSGLLAFYANAHEDRRREFEDLYPYVNFVLGIGIAVFACLGRLLYTPPYPYSRKLWYLLPTALHSGTMVHLVIPRFQECSQVMGDCSSHPGLWSLVQILALLIPTAVFFSAHVPERLLPGYFDIVGHGHQFFHVLHVTMVVLHLNSAAYDILRKSCQAAKPDNTVIFASIVIFLLLGPVILRVFRPLTRKRIETDMSLEAKCNS